MRMNPLGAAILAACSGAGTYQVLYYGFEGTQKGSAIAGLIVAALLFGCLLVED